MATPKGLDMVRSAVRAGIAAAATPEEALHPSVRAPVVTISREAGVRGSSFARLLAEELTRRSGDTWIDYDRQLVERVAADHHLAADLVAQLDERDRSWIEHLIGGLSGRDTGAAMPMKMARTIRGLSRLGRAIIVGRGAQVVLHGLPHVLHVRLVGPLSWRVEQIADRDGIPPQDAEHVAKETDRERARYVRTHYGRNVTDLSLYDLTLNMSRFTLERGSLVIADALQRLEEGGGQHEVTLSGRGRA